jgi:hypothetical protein
MGCAAYVSVKKEMWAKTALSLPSNDGGADVVERPGFVVGASDVAASEGVIFFAGSVAGATADTTRFVLDVAAAVAAFVVADDVVC